MACRRYLVSGRVQGVGFRAATRSQALRLGLQGSALNLRDGRVEVLASGEDASLNQLGDWLRHGPPGARVDALEAEVIEDSAPVGFLIR
ncbi:MAG: acylphosphatase [Elusimicrobia bacterium]|nr:MAG: acylphosphatase [Elusimicrobiota bacterium]